MPTQALILAAGRGSRLGPNTDEVPKPLLQIGPHHLVEHQLSTLSDAGIGPVGIVTGYCADDVQQIVGMRGEFLFNGRWATTNSLASFHVARNWIADDLFVLNCDILFHPDVIGCLLRAGPDSFAIDSSSGEGLEQMKVQLDRDGNLSRMSKSLDPRASQAENVGILYFSHSTAQELLRIAEQLLADGREKDWLGVAVEQLCQTRPLRGVDIAGLPWVEIDFAYDLDRARKEVWPAIRGSRRSIWKRRLSITAAAATLVAAVFGASSDFYYPPDIAPASTAWSAVPVDGAPRVWLNHGKKQQAWWLVENGKSATAQIAGPAEVDIQSRLIFDSAAAETSPFLVEIRVDGNTVDWIRSSGSVSKSFAFGDHSVSKRVRESIQLDAGIHTVELKVSTIDQGRALLRIRLEEEEIDGD